jgi:uncharacterized membrane protein YkoI
MNRRTLFATLVLAIVSAAAVTAVEAQGLVDRRPRDNYRIEPGGISKDEAVQKAERKFNAKVVKAETVNDGERLVYQIRLLNSEGKVWNVRVDAATGRMY